MGKRKQASEEGPYVMKADLKPNRDWDSKMQLAEQSWTGERQKKSFRNWQK